MLILTSLVAIGLPLTDYLFDDKHDGITTEATVTSVLTDERFSAANMGWDDAACPGDSVTIFRGQQYVCRGRIISVTPDVAIVRKSGWGSWRTVKVGDRAVAHVHPDQAQVTIAPWP